MASEPRSLQGASPLSPVLTRCSRSPDHPFSSARLRFLLLFCCLQCLYCLLPPAGQAGGHSAINYTETEQFPAEIEDCLY